MRNTIDIYLCDVCGKEGERYLVLLPGGTMIMDRCPDHSEGLDKLKDEPGEWQPAAKAGKDGGSRGSVRRSSPDDIQQAIARSRGKRA